MSAPTRPVGEMDFETAMKELEEIVTTLETGRVDLNSSIAAYERGEALKLRCEQLLRDAEAREFELAEALRAAGLFVRGGH